MLCESCLRANPYGPDHCLHTTPEGQSAVAIMCYEVTHAFSGMVWQLRVVDSEETARTIAMVRIESGQEHELQQVALPNT
jgi:hypothetical protein